MWKSIPDFSEPGDCVEFHIGDSSFVELIDSMEFDVKMQYPRLGMRNAQERCYVRKEVYERLLLAKEMLPSGVSMRILDAWRPFELQKELYLQYSKVVIENFQLQNVDAAEQRKVIKKYVSVPVEDVRYAPVHTTGGAVDLTLVDESGNELNMGTKFDEFSLKAHTCYFENGEDIQVRNNRRILYNVMSKAGFTNLPSEWWHFDYGDRFWAFYKKKPVIYEGIFTVEEVLDK